MAPWLLFTKRLMLQSLHSGLSLSLWAIRSIDEATVAGLSWASKSQERSRGKPVSQSPQLAHYMTGREERSTAKKHSVPLLLSSPHSKEPSRNPGGKLFTGLFAWEQLCGEGKRCRKTYCRQLDKYLPEKKAYVEKKLMQRKSRNATKDGVETSHPSNYGHCFYRD